MVPLPLAGCVVTTAPEIGVPDAVSITLPEIVPGGPLGVGVGVGAGVAVGVALGVGVGVGVLLGVGVGTGPLICVTTTLSTSIT